jgi:hypothetical protein
MECGIGLFIVCPFFIARRFGPALVLSLPPITSQRPLGLRLGVCPAAVVARAELDLPHSAVSQERAQSYQICHCSCGKQLDGCPHGSNHLVPMLLDGLGDSVNGDANGQKAKAEQHGEQNLSFGSNSSREDDWNREYDERDINDCAADSHCEKLREALTALWPWIRNDLPIVSYRMAFCKVAHYDGHKGSRKNAS